MMFGKSAAGKAVIAALLLVMVGWCRSLPVKRNTVICGSLNTSAVNTVNCSSVDRRIFLELGHEYMAYAYKYTVQELSSTNSSVCALFNEYSRLSVTLENHRENDSLQTNLTLLVMIAEKLLIDSCEHSVETSNSSFNCSSIGSIAWSCLEVENRSQSQLKVNMDTHPSCWMTEFYRNSCPESEVWDTLLENLERESVNCSLTQDNDYFLL